MSQITIREGGNVHTESLDSFCARDESPSFTWLHIDGRREDARAIAGRLKGMPETALNALVAQETRPRCTLMGGGALINLRGPGAIEANDGDPLVSIRIWAQKGRVVSVTYRRMTALEPVAARMQAGDIQDPGDFISALAQTITDEMDPDVARLGDDLDEIESSVSEDTPTEVRRTVSRIRAAAISYRRFLAPQRQAIERLALADFGKETGWLEEEDRLHLQEAADRCARMAEELEAVRERAALAHENLTDLRAEKMNQQALVLAIVALVFLPLTFVTGLLGMNVEGIPFAHEPWAFAGVTGLCLMLSLGITAWFLAHHWFGRR